MTTPALPNEIQIDRACSAAICEEIGDRLRIRLGAEPNRLPQDMLTLVDQMLQISALFEPAIEVTK